MLILFFGNLILGKLNMDERIILLVEDNPDDIKLTQRAFNKSKIAEKISLEVAINGEEALDFLFGKGLYSHRNKKLIPVVILLDLNLPRINGLQVLERIRSDERTKLIPVIVLTSSKEQQDVKKAYALGANSYIRKPVDFEKFSEVAQQLGLYWVELNEAPPN
jgi:two-component system response regulator